MNEDEKKLKERILSTVVAVQQTDLSDGIESFKTQISDVSRYLKSIVYTAQLDGSISTDAKNYLMGYIEGLCGSAVCEWSEEMI
jgi:hypothetical protein